MVPVFAVFSVVLVIVGVTVNAPAIYHIYREKKRRPYVPEITRLVATLNEALEEKKFSAHLLGASERLLALEEEHRYPLEERRAAAMAVVLNCFDQITRHMADRVLRKHYGCRWALIRKVEALLRNPEYRLGESVGVRAHLCMDRAILHMDCWEYAEVLGEIASMPIPEEREGMFVSLGKIMAMRYFTHLDMITGSEHHGYFSAIVHKRLMPHLKLDPSEVLVAVMTKHGGVSFPLALAELGAPAEEVEASARACFDWQFEHFNALRDAAIAAGGQVAVMRNRWDAGYSLCRLLALPFSFTDEARRMFAKYVEIREWELAYVVIQNFPEVFDKADRGTVFHGLGEDVLTKEEDDEPAELPQFDVITVGEQPFGVTVG